jgi:hypothetical protein
MVTHFKVRMIDIRDHVDVFVKWIVSSIFIGEGECTDYS